MELFHGHGIHPVGLDRVLLKAGVTKTTFYNHFESKEIFACAIINRYGEELRKQIRLRIENPRPSQIKQHLLGLLDTWEKIIPSRKSRGCLLMGAGVSSGDPNDPARQAAVENKERIVEAFCELAHNAGFKDPKAFAIRFSILLDGSLVARHLYDNGRGAEEARRMARDLIDQELRKIDQRKQ